MHYPKVQFKLDKNFDKEIGTYFLNSKIGTYDFGKDRIISEHPEFSKWRKLEEKELKKKVGKYVDNYYMKHKEEIQKSIEKMQKIWDKIEVKYFKEVEKIFGKLSFYSPKIISANVSIFKCGIVDENLKAFQIWYKTINDSKEVRRHIAHEVLHFYYYTYLQKMGYEKLSKNWDLAEIFNRIILNLPSFLILTERQDMGYSLHTRRVPKYRKMWEKSSGIGQYLEIVNRKR